MVLYGKIGGAERRVEWGKGARVVKVVTRRGELVRFEVEITKLSLSNVEVVLVFWYEIWVFLI